MTSKQVIRAPTSAHSIPKSVSAADSRTLLTTLNLQEAITHLCAVRAVLRGLYCTPSTAPSVNPVMGRADDSGQIIVAPERLRPLLELCNTSVNSAWAHIEEVLELLNTQKHDEEKAS